MLLWRERAPQPPSSGPCPTIEQSWATTFVPALDMAMLSSAYHCYGTCTNAWLCALPVRTSALDAVPPLASWTVRCIGLLRNWLLGCVVKRLLRFGAPLTPVWMWCEACEAAEKPMQLHGLTRRA